MAISKQFVLAGTATFTVQKPDGSHVTYKVEKLPVTETFRRETYVVSMMIGSDNETDYLYIGVLSEHLGQVCITRRSPHSIKQDARFRLLNRVLARVWGDDHKAYEQHGYRTIHSGHCGRCGRKLTTPESCDTGIGPECRRVMGIDPVKPAKKERPKVETKDVNYYTGPKTYFASDSNAPPTFGMTPHYNHENELTHWTDPLTAEVVFND